MTSKQAVTELLRLGSRVNLLNRKKIMHAKMYGVASNLNTVAIVTSGNFTGNGIALNIEASLYLDGDDLINSGFAWSDACAALESRATWNVLEPKDLTSPGNPGWKLLFDEDAKAPTGGDAWQEEDQVLAMTLSPTDVARIVGSQKNGTQYFWLSRFVAGYFPPLTDLPVKLGAKRTFKTTVQVDFLDLGVIHDCTVTFEAYNNLDFRLLTSPFKGTSKAHADDMMLLRRNKERAYRMRIVPKGTHDYSKLMPYLINPIGIRNKRFGWVPKKLVASLV
jgi:hypothetical protein